MALDEINARLLQRGFNPIAPRTYSHYRKLHRYGYQRYVPINQLDVETLRDPVWEGPLRSRYRPRDARVPAHLVLTINDQVVTLEGETKQISPAEVVLQFRDPTAREIFANQNLEGNHALIVLQPEVDTRSVLIELVQLSEDTLSALVTLAFLSLAPIHELPGELSLEAMDAKARITAYESHSPLSILRELYAFFEALDASRVVCDQILAGLDTESQYVFPPLRITSLKLQSPLEIAMTVASAPLFLLIAIARRYEHFRQDHAAADMTRAHVKFRTEEARTLQIQNERREFHAEMERLAVVSYVIRILQQNGVGKAQPLEGRADPRTLDEVNELLKTQLYPSLERLFDDNVKLIAFDTQVSPPPLEEQAPQEGRTEGAA